MSDLSLLLEPETPDDAEAIEHLNARVFGPGRYARSAYRIRETADPDPALSFVARVGTLLVGANAMTPIDIGGQPALLLGPLIVEPVFRSQGIGEALVDRRWRRRRPRAGRSSSWSATNPITRAWGSSRSRPAASRCPAGRPRPPALLRTRARRARGGEGRGAGRLSVSQELDLAQRRGFVPHDRQAIPIGTRRGAEARKKRRHLLQRCRCTIFQSSPPPMTRCGGKSRRACATGEWTRRANSRASATSMRAWRDPGLISAQTCGYPYLTALQDCAVLVATPEYAFPAATARIIAASSSARATPSSRTRGVPRRGCRSQCL